MDKALLLAAGLGSRIRSVAGDLPKPLMPFAGAPVLAHNLRWLAQGGVREVWINLHYGADQIRAAIGDGEREGLSIHYVYEPALLGTAGALANIEGLFQGPILVVYGDNVSRFDLHALAADHRAAGAEATLALFDVDRHAHTGIAGGRVTLADDRRVAGFVEGAAAGSSLVNAGLYLIEPSLLDLIPRRRLVDFGRDVFPAALAAGRRLQGHVIEQDGFCLGLDTPEAYQRAADLVRAGAVRLPA